jgi:hypothetical protein
LKDTRLIRALALEGRAGTCVQTSTCSGVAEVMFRLD